MSPCAHTVYWLKCWIVEPLIKLGSNIGKKTVRWPKSLTLRIWNSGVQLRETIRENTTLLHTILCRRQYNPTVVMRFLQQQGASECQADILLNGGDIHWRLLNAKQNFQRSAWLTHHAVTVVQLLTRLIPTHHLPRLSGRPARLPIYLALPCIPYLDCVWMWFIQITLGPDINIWLQHSDQNQIALFLHNTLIPLFFFSLF